MNKNMFIIATLALVVFVFAAGTYFYMMQNPSKITEFTQERPELASTQIDIKPSEQTNTLVRPHSPIIGEKNAPVTIVEFFDPSCESCRAFYPIIEAIRKKYPTEVRVILRYAAFHQGSDEAVRILEAAKVQDIFVPVLEKLLERQPEWAIHGAPDIDKAWNLAGEAGLDLVQGRKDAQNPAITEILSIDNADIQANNVQGTPTFFINGNRLQSFGQQQLIEAVDSAVINLKNNR